MWIIYYAILFSIVCYHTQNQTYEESAKRHISTHITLENSTQKQNEERYLNKLCIDIG